MDDLSTIEREFGDLSRWAECPDFWVPQPQHAAGLIESLSEATMREIGFSAGGRRIQAIEYGEKEPLETTTDNLQSALAGYTKPGKCDEIFPPAFYGVARRKKPVVVLQGGIHGGELTGTVAALNLCRIIETGADLRGKAWPKLQELARETRILIIPWLNIDGVTRWPLPNTSGVPLELYARCLHGVAIDGTAYRYPKMKSLDPIPPSQTAFMGSYFNDAGVNLQYDFCNPHRQPETVAWMEYYLRERPDGVLIWHCNAGSMIGPPPHFVPVGHQHEESRLAGVVRNRLLREGFAIGRISLAALPNMGTPFMNQVDATYHVCGATPILCELPCGAREHYFNCNEMLDIGLLTIEEFLYYAHTDGLRPYEWWEKIKGTATTGRVQDAAKNG